MPRLPFWIFSASLFGRKSNDRLGEMADEQHMPLSYPNPSFSQMACLEDHGTRADGLDKPVAEAAAPPVRGLRQAVLMASYAAEPRRSDASDVSAQAPRRPLVLEPRHVHRVHVLDDICTSSATLPTPP